MQTKTIQVAQDFCQLVGHPHMLAYLGLDSTCSPEQAMEKLRARRRFMQGMQNNPKFKQEALFLIKNYSALLSTLNDPRLHVSIMEQHRQVQNLPALESTIRNVLKSGQVTAEDKEFLHTNAIDLGVPNAIFQEVLARIATELGIHASQVDRGEDTSGFWSNNPYVVLDISADATPLEIEAANERRRKQARSLPRITLSNRALNQLAAAMETIQEGRATIQPVESPFPSDLRSPITANKGGDEPTAPPTKIRMLDDDDMVKRLVIPPKSKSSNIQKSSVSNMEIIGDPSRHLYLRRRPVREIIEVRSRSGLPLYGAISTNVGWLHATPALLNGESSKAMINVRVNPNEMINPHEQGRVSIHPEDGSPIHVQFEVKQIRSWSLPLLIAAFVAAVFLSISAFYLFPTSLDSCANAGGLIIEVDPLASAIIVNGEKRGAGTSATYRNPPIGETTISIVQSNFRPFQTTLQMEPGQIEKRMIILELDSPMDFAPTAEMEQTGLRDIPFRAVPTALLDSCLQRGNLTKKDDTELRIFIGKNGKASGTRISGAGNENESVRRCLVRLAATVSFAPLKQGDYAVLDYSPRLDKSP